MPVLYESKCEGCGRLVLSVRELPLYVCHGCRAYLCHGCFHRHIGHRREHGKGTCGRLLPRNQGAA